MDSSLGIKLSCLSSDTNLVFINQMDKRVIEDSPADPAEFMKLLLESQQQQNERVTIALKKMVASESQARQENVSDFRRLHLAVFTGEESHMNAEQWLIKTENLLVAAQVPEADRVDVVKI